LPFAKAIVNRLQRFRAGKARVMEVRLVLAVALIIGLGGVVMAAMFAFL
jgi:hypothetical protein